VARIHSPFDENEWRCSNDAALLLHFREDRVPIVDLEIFAVAQDPNIRASNQDLLTKIPLKTIHDSENEYQRTYADEHTADCDNADQRQQARAAAAPQVSGGD
jgi:hypothetical protein